MASFGERMMGAARLDAATYEELEADTGALGQAVGVVVLAGLAAGIGLRAGAGGLVTGVIASVMSWYLWALITYWIGGRWLAEPATRADMGQMLRTIGFASAPGVLRVIGVIPGLQKIAFVVAALWMLAAVVVAVRQALDFQSTGRAVAVCVIGWIVQGLIFIVLLNLIVPRPAL